LPIARLLGEVFADSGYDASTQFEFLGDRKLANLWKLLDLARTFDGSGLFGLADLIQRLGELVQSQPREEQAATQPESADVVRLMTIHQAKGLEFPVVIVPDVCAVGGGSRPPVAHWDARLGCVVRPPVAITLPYPQERGKGKGPADEPFLFPDFGWKLWETAEAVEEWREDLRTLYVASTRAQDYLVLSAALPDNYSPSSIWMLKLAERFDLHDGRCLEPTIPPEHRPPVRVTNRLAPPPDLSLPRTKQAPGSLDPLSFDPHRIQALAPGKIVEGEGTLEGADTLYEDGDDDSARGPWGVSGQGEDN
jgi:ATP-dependent helicase/nuclease subunit A